VTSYNQTVSSLESRVLVTARRMTDLHVVDPTAVIETPKQITETPRSTQAAELTDNRVIALPKQRTSAGQTDLLVAVREAASGETS